MWICIRARYDAPRPPCVRRGKPRLAFPSLGGSGRLPDPRLAHLCFWMGSTGRNRLNASDEFFGSLDSQVLHPTFEDADAETNNEFVERRSKRSKERTGTT
jgi:hypothetical protein